ncbi:hypothetical protein IW261DRAFT_1339963 [Armillaria novae-zelandiae]|uniref:TFIIS-type domain-containing protein n=1 Tax=Armillaria novae-zelandiae TaxID=153914 RepID=A0AA39P2Q6_9AGAR|nr:hypothetical protein IW261DRAFT_1339963 [Armillaria novae-zelandiae]
MLFCPSCANILIIGDADGKNKWVCQTCPYQFPITKQVRHTSRTLLDSKKVDDMRDVSSELSSGARTACMYECAKCGHGFSYFSQLQIRSADEPMTTCEYLPLCVSPSGELTCGLTVYKCVIRIDRILYSAYFRYLFLDVYPVGMFAAKINKERRATVLRISNIPVVRSLSHVDTNLGPLHLDSAQFVYLPAVRLLIPAVRFNVCTMRT